jgi:hypothetical protein
MCNIEVAEAIENSLITENTFLIFEKHQKWGHNMKEYEIKTKNPFLIIKQTCCRQVTGKLILESF